MNNFSKRLLTGIVFVSAIISSLIFHPFIFAGAFLIVQYLLLNEFYSIIKKAGFQSPKKVGLLLGSVVFLTLFGYSYGWLNINYIFLIFPLLFIVFIYELYRNKENPIANVSITLMGIFYITLPISLLNFVVFPGLPENGDFYPLILVGVFFILWTYDSGAYIFGMWFGKRKLFERISPKKSWEGAIGGGAMGLIVSILNSLWIQELDLLSWIVIGFLIIIFGTFGDLFESLIKRRLNLKDTGNVLPGHGGFLDRFDSLLFAIPFIFVWLLLFSK